MRNIRFSGTRILGSLQERFPEGWALSLRSETSKGVDGILELTGPDGSASELLLRFKAHLDARDVLPLVAWLQQTAGGRPALVWSEYLGPRTRQLLREAGVSYGDATGNLRVALDRPAVFLEAAGAARDPRARRRPLRSLKGRAASRAVRALCDFREPYGVRELASRSGTSLGTLARVVDLLDREAVLVRDAAGRVVEVRVAELIRRWAEDYELTKTNRVRYCLEPRGLEAMESLGLRAVDAGANVLLAMPYDPVVFERTWEADGLRFAALSQVAVDLLTSPGRGPAEADALLDFMAAKPGSWRA